MILEQSDGTKAENPEHAQELGSLGYQRCYGRQFNPAQRAYQPCNFFLTPQTKANVLDQGGGYFTCPQCKTSHDIMEEFPSHIIDQDYGDWEEGGRTRVGLSLEEQAQIGEDLIEQLHSLPGYGPITWWHEGGAGSQSPLDGATRDWGIEVKTIGYDAIHHRFIPGSPNIKGKKNAQAEEMKLKGVLGVLVLLNYRTSFANIYVKEMPLEGWTNSRGRNYQGVASFRSTDGQHLIEQIPFKNPLADPHSGLPAVASNDDLPF